MEFGIEKCAIFVIRRGKRANNGRDGIVNPRKNLKAPKKENYNCLGILEEDTIRQAESEKITRTIKLLKTKLCSRNLIKGISSKAVPLFRDSELLLKWTRKELERMDQRTRKLISMQKA